MSPAPRYDASSRVPLSPEAAASTAACGASAVRSKSSAWSDPTRWPGGSVLAVSGARDDDDQSLLVAVLTTLEDQKVKLPARGPKMTRCSGRSRSFGQR